MIVPPYDDRPPEVVAAEKGLDIIYPAANELFIDIDSIDDYLFFQAQTEILLQIDPGAKWAVRPSRNREEGRHIVVTLSRPVVSEYERLAFQAALSSDRKRELLGLRRLANGMKNVSCFFVRKP